jgi:hypothetical protein
MTILFLLNALAGYAWADISLYLYPRINYTSNVMLSHIAIIEGDTAAVEMIKNMSIDENFFSNGYLDKRDIINILKDAAVGRINIYGSGVRMIKLDSNAESLSSQKCIKKGDTVRFQVVSSRIRIELPGTAMKDGAAGDVIPVKLKGSKVASGKILNERVVELRL